MTKRALSAEEFISLPEEARMDLLHKDGVHVGKRKIGGLSVILFQLYSFYVEVHYTRYRRDIDHMIATEDVGMLQPYLDQIHVRDLKNGKDQV
jgi:hypothetical protein